MAGITYAAGAFYYTSGLAVERAELIIAAAENYKASNGQYPNSMSELVPRFIPEIPKTARIDGFHYYAGRTDHRLSYMYFPPGVVKQYPDGHFKIPHFWPPKIPQAGLAKL